MLKDVVVLVRGSCALVAGYWIRGAEMYRLYGFWPTVRQVSTYCELHRHVTSIMNDKEYIN